MRTTEWTESENMYLSQNYADMPPFEIAKALDRPISAVVNRANKMQLTKRGRAPGKAKSAICWSCAKGNVIDCAWVDKLEPVWREAVMAESGQQVVECDHYTKEAK